MSDAEKDDLLERAQLLQRAKQIQAQQQKSAQDQPGLGLKQTALEHGANAVALGYLPQLQAAAEPITTGIGNVGIRAQNLFSGHKQPLVEPSPYLEARDANIKRIQAQAVENPKAALASDIGGAVVGGIATPIPGLGAAKGIIGGVARGAASGALQAGLQNPGDVEGQINPMQINERLEKTEEGAVIGGLTAGAGEGIRKGLRGFSKAAPALKDIAEASALKSSGAMLKDFREAYGKEDVNKLGRFMIDNKLAKAGNSYQDVHEGAEKIREQAGKELGQIYDKALETIKDPKILENMPGFNPVRDKEKLIALVKTELGDALDAESATTKISNYIDNLAKKYGDKTLDPRIQNDIKGAVDDSINYSRNPLARQPDQEKALKATRKYLSSKIDSSIDFLGKAAGDDKALEKLKDANSRYGSSSQISKIARDRSSREAANQMFGLTDKIAGGSAAVAGSVVGGTPGGLLAAGGGMLANKAGRKYGPGLISSGAELGSKIAAPLSVPAGIASKLIPNAGLMGRIGANVSREEKRK